MMRSRLRSLLLVGACAAAVCGCQSYGSFPLYDKLVGGNSGGMGNLEPLPNTAAATTPDKDADKGVIRASFWDFDHSLITPPAPADSFSMSAAGLVADAPPKPDSPEALLAGAHELFRRNDLDTAELAFHRLADNSHNPVKVIEEARYYEAECLRLQGRYPKAADTYNDLLNKFSQTPYRDQAIQHMYDIANYWLEDTRAEMKEDQEVREGKRSFHIPQFLHFEHSKPVVAEQDRALEKLQQVQLHDPNGPLADKAMFLSGSVHYYIQDYRSAVQDFKEITDHHPNSPWAPAATEMAIIALHLSTGGPDYDGRNSAEARRLIQVAFDNYPELAEDKKKRAFLNKQLENITYQQAEKDYKQAEFYRRSGHPGSAYFYYGLIIKTYPTTQFAQLAKDHMQELRAAADKENGVPQSAPTVAPRMPSGTPPAGQPGVPPAPNPALQPRAGMPAPG